MSETPNPKSLEDRLQRALDELVVTLTVGRKTLSPRLNALTSSTWRRESMRMARRLVGDGRWAMDAPAFLAVRDWVDARWRTGRATTAPPGTVKMHDPFTQPSEDQLDPATATRKLIVAAAIHGAKTVAGYAAEFGTHGLIEVHSIYLLKGASIANAQPLDDYCALIPYRTALQRSNTVPVEAWPDWPPEETDGICALDCRGFERRTLHGFENEQIVSPLLRHGPESLALVLGLVWGNGLRVFGNWHAVPTPVAAALPFPALSPLGGRGSRRVELALRGWERGSRKRPLAVGELAELMARYADLLHQSRHVLELAMRRLRDSTERMEYADSVIDMCIALEALFMDEGEDWKQRKLIARRGSWYFADSRKEREQTRRVLEEFYDLRSKIVHGRHPVRQTPREATREDKRYAEMFTAVANIARDSLKSMIADGRPKHWEESKDPASIRRDPPRSESEIPSVKSDSLSWSVEQRKAIDRALEAVWRPTVETAPSPPDDAGAVIHHGLRPDALAECRHQGIHYVIRHPALLYMAHPKWPKDPSDPLDERTEYYCEKDVERHMQRWLEAASEKKLTQFELPTDATLYHPRHRDRWPRPLR